MNELHVMFIMCVYFFPFSFSFPSFGGALFTSALMMRLYYLFKHLTLVSVNGKTKGTLESV